MDDELLQKLVKLATQGDADAGPTLHSLLAGCLHDAELTGSITPTVARVLADMHQRMAQGEQLFPKFANRPIQTLRDERIGELVTVLDAARSAVPEPITPEARERMHAVLALVGISPETDAAVDKALDMHAANCANPRPARARVFELVGGVFGLAAKSVKNKTVKNKAR
ncbi:MAG: hypothetical protein EPN49_15775 [Rhodanobacter sp.]|nr:MAG: hypothetical protein EPN49_15775 [Rhodanobacter sp.]